MNFETSKATVVKLCTTFQQLPLKNNSNKSFSWKTPNYILYYQLHCTVRSVCMYIIIIQSFIFNDLQ